MGNFLTKVAQKALDTTARKKVTDQLVQRRKARMAAGLPPVDTSKAEALAPRVSRLGYVKDYGERLGENLLSAPARIAQVASNAVTDNTAGLLDTVGAHRWAQGVRNGQSAFNDYISKHLMSDNMAEEYRDNKIGKFFEQLASQAAGATTSGAALGAAGKGLAAGGRALQALRPAATAAASGGKAGWLARNLPTATRYAGKANDAISSVGSKAISVANKSKLGRLVLKAVPRKGGLLPAVGDGLAKSNTPFSTRLSARGFAPLSRSPLYVAGKDGLERVGRLRRLLAGAGNAVRATTGAQAAGAAAGVLNNTRGRDILGRQITEADRNPYTQAFDWLGMNMGRERARAGDQHALDENFDRMTTFDKLHATTGNEAKPTAATFGGRRVRLSDKNGNPTNGLLAGATPNQARRMAQAMSDANAGAASQDYGALDTGIVGKLRGKRQPGYALPGVEAVWRPDGSVGYRFRAKPAMENGEQVTYNPYGDGRLAESVAGFTNPMSYVTPWTAPAAWAGLFENGIRNRDYADLAASAAMAGVPFVPKVNKVPFGNLAGAAGIYGVDALLPTGKPKDTARNRRRQALADMLYQASQGKAPENYFPTFE